MKLDITAVFGTESVGASPTMPTNMRLKTKAEKQAERGTKTPPKYNRAFSRSKWRKESGDMFMYRGKMGPDFHQFEKSFKNETILPTV